MRASARRAGRKISGNTPGGSAPRAFRPPNHGPGRDRRHASVAATASDLRRGEDHIAHSETQRKLRGFVRGQRETLTHSATAPQVQCPPRCGGHGPGVANERHRPARAEAPRYQPSAGAMGRAVGATPFRDQVGDAGRIDHPAHRTPTCGARLPGTRPSTLVARPIRRLRAPARGRGARCRDCSRRSCDRWRTCRHGLCSGSPSSPSAPCRGTRRRPASARRSTTRNRRAP